MSGAPSAPVSRDSRIVPTLVVCRNLSRRTEIQQAIPEATACPSAIEGTLAALRAQPEAVLLNAEDVEGREVDLVRSLRRARPDLRIYVMVSAEAEPLGRQLLKSGATEYLVVPGDIRRLARILSAAPPEPPPSPEGAAPGDEEAAAKTPVRGPDWESLFGASCAVAGLALCDPDTILSEGTHILAGAIGAEHASVFTWKQGAEGLELRGTITVPGRHDGRLSDFEQSCAERGAGSSETLFFPVDRADASQAGGAPSAAKSSATLAAVPMREGDESLGAVCLVCEEVRPVPAEWEAIRRLVDDLGRLYRAAVQRAEYARLALRDPETGLMAADTFRACLEKVLAQAAEEKSEVALAILEVAGEGEGRGPPAPTLAQFGRILASEESLGKLGGRLAPGRFAVAWPHRPGDGEPPEAAAFLYRALVEELSALGARINPPLPLRIGLAVFPNDGREAGALLAAAERLAKDT